jgi:hypothetical protein
VPRAVLRHALANMDNGLFENVGDFGVRHAGGTGQGGDLSKGSRVGCETDAIRNPKRERGSSVPIFECAMYFCQCLWRRCLPRACSSRTVRVIGSANLYRTPPKRLDWHRSMRADESDALRA